MDYQDYLTGISFRFLQPDTKVNKNFAKILSDLSRVGFPLQFWNTVLPENDKATKRALRKVCRVPKMSTFAMGAIINRGVSQMPEGHIYVNVGVWQGFTFFAGLVNNEDKHCVGIDNFSRPDGQHNGDIAFPKWFKKFGSENHHFYEMDYRDYFKNIHKESIGFYLYDGEHSYNNQFESLEIAEPFLAKDCIIMIDDINKDDPYKATMDFIKARPNQYKILLDTKTYANCHPTFWDGVMVFQKVV